MIPTKEQLLQVQRRIAPYVSRTPIYTSQTLDLLSGARILLKSEQLQRMGAFKMRGATNAILSLSDDQRQAGVVTHSSGNFGQAVALAAKTLGVKAHIVMPDNAPLVKRQAVAGYGGKIQLCAPTLKAREAATQAIVQQTGATALHPSNALEVILGNATAGIELLEEYPKTDILIAPVGGGGLIAGTALAAHHFGQNCITIGAEPKAVDDAYRSLQSGTIQTNQTTKTIADGLKTQLGDQNFPIIQQLVDQIITVSEQEVVDAMRLLWERCKLVVEPSSAVALAAVLGRPEIFEGKTVGLILSGGNVDLTNLPF